MTQKAIKISRVIEKEMPGYFNKEMLDYQDHSQKLINQKFTGVDYSGRVWLNGMSVTIKKFWNKGDVPLPKEHVMKEYRLEILNKSLFHQEYLQYSSFTEKDVINLLDEKYKKIRKEMDTLNLHSV